MKDTIEKISAAKVIPVITCEAIDEVMPKMNAVIKGGLNCAEIAFRTECAAEAVKLAADNFPEAVIGAGTVINKMQCEEAIIAGAKFIVSPGFSAEVAKCCEEHNTLYISGVATPTEAMAAVENGLNVLEFFPAEGMGGVKTLKEMSVSFPEVKFAVAGGINAKNIGEYLAADKVLGCFVEVVADGTAEEITAKARAIAKKVL